jgi:hypothetical protein
VFDPILVEFECMEGGDFRGGAFGLTFSAFLNFTVDKLLEMLAEDVHAPLPLDLEGVGVDQIHYLPLTHLLLPLRPLLLLSPLFGLGNA